MFAVQKYPFILKKGADLPKGFSLGIMQIDRRPNKL